MKRHYNFKIDISKQNKFEIPYLKQGDRRTNVINIELFDGADQLPLDDKSLTLIYLTPDEQIVYQTEQDVELPITKTGNKLTGIMSSAVLALPGLVQMELLVNKGSNELLTTQKVFFDVRPQIDVNRVIKTQSEFPVILRLIEDVEAILLSYEDVKSDIVNEQDRIANEIVRESNEVNREALKSSLEALKTQLTTDLNAFNTESQQKIVELIAEKERVEAIYPVRLTALETTKVNNKNYSVKFEVVDNQPRLKMEEK